jgi:diguanylate cyclase (GGDEF)-like protein
VRIDRDVSVQRIEMADTESDNKRRSAARDKDPIDLDDDGIPPDARSAILNLLEEIEYLRTEIEANNKRIAELEDLADRDPLAPVVNRRAFVRELDRAKAYADRYGGGACLIYLDLDGMKEINDRFGHAAGDLALLAVAEALVANVRSSDLVGRLGGDEFGVILARASRRAAEEKAEALMRLIGGLRIDSSAGPIPVSVSYGIVELKAHPDADAALAAADRGMYERKKARRGGAG